MHIEYCLSNIENNTNSKNNFIIIIDLSSTFLHIIIYLEILLDITIKLVNL